jgi:hypothetical protein
LPKPKPPFDVGTLVTTKNDLTYLSRSSFYSAGNSTEGQYENYQYPQDTILMVVEVSKTPLRGWKYKFMTPDRGILDSGHALFRSWKHQLKPVV